ncbi:hypothetical protein U1Q18_017478 [Sarracenia purpurea var. burkii]
MPLRRVRAGSWNSNGRGEGRTALGGGEVGGEGERWRLRLFPHRSTLPTPSLSLLIGVMLLRPLWRIFHLYDPRRVFAAAS